MDIFFYEAFQEEAQRLKHYLGDKIEASFTWKTIQEYGAEIPPAKLISIRTQSEIPLAWASNLNGILSRSTGYDHIKAYWEKADNKPQAGYLPLYCHRAVAEQAMVMWMVLLRKLPEQMRNLELFHRDGLSGLETEGKNLLVVGVGNIGYEVVRIGHGLGMHVKGIDLVERHKDVEYTSLKNGLIDADIVVCAMNLTGSNRAYFNYETLAQGKHSKLFVNISRGELSPPSDMLRLLKDKHLYGLGMDVYDHEKELAWAFRNQKISNDEQVRAVEELRKHHHVILTPHNAFNTWEGVERKASQSIEQLEEFLESGTFKWPVPEEEIRPL